MFLCSDLKSRNKLSESNTKQLTYNNICLFHNKNLKNSIDVLKDSLNQKQQFFSFYNEVNAYYGGINKDKGIMIRSDSEVLKLKNNLHRNNNSSVNIKEEYPNKNQRETNRNSSNDVGYNLNNNYKLKPLITANLPKEMVTMSPVDNSKSKKFDKFREENKDLNDNNIGKILLSNSNKHSITSENKNVGNLKKSVSYGNFILNQHDKKDKKFSQFNKIFDKNLIPILQVKYDRKPTIKRDKININDEREKFAEKSRINSQIVEMRDKLHFMKGIIDYSFPKILIDKIKIYQENTIDNKTSKELKNVLNRQDSKILQTQNYRSIPIKINNVDTPQKGQFDKHFYNLTRSKIKVMSPLRIKSVTKYDFNL